MRDDITEILLKMALNTKIQNSNSIVAVSFIGGGNHSTWIKP
jgi:hypothetical protein